MHFTVVHIHKVNTHARSYLGWVSFFCKTAAQQNHSCCGGQKLCSTKKLMTLAPCRLITPQEPFSEEIVQAIANCVVKQLCSSIQDGDSSWATEVVPSTTASQGTSGVELFLWCWCCLSYTGTTNWSWKILSALWGEIAVHKGKHIAGSTYCCSTSPYLV